MQGMCRRARSCGFLDRTIDDGAGLRQGEQLTSRGAVKVCRRTLRGRPGKGLQYRQSWFGQRHQLQGAAAARFYNPAYLHAAPVLGAGVTHHPHRVEQARL